MPAIPKTLRLLQRPITVPRCNHRLFGKQHGAKLADFWHQKSPFPRASKVRQVAALTLLAALTVCSAAAAANNPNILVLLSDDQGCGDFSFAGNTNLSTPNVDALVRDGALFQRFYVCPMCAPTRAEFLTGRYHPRTGVHNVSSGGERLNADEVTVADTFKAAGYATALFGKWHNGQQWPYHPNGRGFDEFYGFCSGHWGDYFSPPLDHNGAIVNGNGYLEDDLADHAMSFIEQHSDAPWFAYVAFNSPHSPMQVPDHWWNEFKDKELKLRATNADREDINHTRAALAMCENVDWNVGRLLVKLDDLKLAENTIVVYFCDNGPNGARWTGGLKGIKGSTDEGGIRSPLIIRWPGKIQPNSKIAQLAGAIDLLPTLAALASVPLINTPLSVGAHAESTANKPLDGQSFAAQLLANENENGSTNAPIERATDRLLFTRWAGNVSVCTQQYRLDRDGRLFDIIADPGQKHDVSKQHPEVQAKLAAAVAEWRKDVLTGIANDRRPFTIGHPGSMTTELAAADAVPHGNIERSAKPPNSSFFTNWKSTDDKITWNAEVLTTGDYDVELYYTCPPGDVGSTIELSFAGNRVTGKVTTANDPPLRGAEHDRVPRGESYVKDFRPLKLGTIHLEKGTGELTLQATKIPGTQVMDLRLLVLKRRKS